MHVTAVLDSACSSTVCGKVWLDGYLKSLDKEDRGKVVQAEGAKIFKFGGGTRLKSEGAYSIPAIVAGKQVTSPSVFNTSLGTLQMLMNGKSCLIPLLMVYTSQAIKIISQ